MLQSRMYLRSAHLTAVVGTVAALFVLFLLAACNVGGVEQETIQVTYEAEPVVQTRNPTATPASSLPQSEQSTSSAGQSDATPTTIERDLDLVTVLAKDAIPAIRSPEFVDAAGAEAWMSADEPIIGVEIGGDARAYPVAMLSRHEIVNDTVGGAPIAATW